MVAALEPKRRLAYGDEDAGHGAELREQPWQPPPTITEDDLFGARQYVQAFQAEDYPAQGGVIEKWLLTVCAGLNHAMDEPTLRLRLTALAASIDDRPTFCFTTETRRQAQRRFEHVPTAKELIDFFDGIEAEERRDVKRLWAIIDTGPRRPGAKPDDRAGPRQRSDFRWSVDEAEEHAQYLRERQDRERKELAGIVARRDKAAGLPPIDERQPAREFGEGDRDYVNRVVAWNARNMDMHVAHQRRLDADRRRAQLDEARATLTGEPFVKREPPVTNSAPRVAPAVQPSSEQTGSGEP